MAASPEFRLILSKYQEVFGARPSLGFPSFLFNRRGAALGYRRAGDEPLFLEQYLDEPIEDAASKAIGRPTARADIVELGNFASDNALAMIELWGSAANDLAAASGGAVATLTAPLRRMLARIGVPVAPVGYRARSTVFAMVGAGLALDDGPALMLDYVRTTAPGRSGPPERIVEIAGGAPLEGRGLRLALTGGAHDDEAGRLGWSLSASSERRPSSEMGFDPSPRGFSDNRANLAMRMAF